MKIIALTNHGGMVIGQEYEVTAEMAVILTSVKRAKYTDESLNPIVGIPVALPNAESVPKARRRRTTKE